MKVLDLFCGGGGAAMGLHRAWPDAEITGVDINPQKNYPFKFIQADAMTFPLDSYDFIWASPPCQGVSIMRNLPWIKDKTYEVLIAPTRERLNAWGGPYIIENVMGARWGSKQLARLGLAHHGMQAGWLCGTMFGLPFYRHRLFETNWPWLQPGHEAHKAVISEGRMLGNREKLSQLKMQTQTIGIDWMTRDELSQAIPPAYSEFLGRQLRTCRKWWPV